MERTLSPPDWLLMVCVLLVSVCGFPANIQKPAEPNPTEAQTEVRSELLHDYYLQPLRDLQEENLLQTLPSSPSSKGSRRNWADGVLPPPAPEEVDALFILDLRNFPELANADVSSQNPNIQVTIEVEEDTHAEVEMDLVKDSQRSDWSVTSSAWASSHRKLFWPLFRDHPDRLINGTANQDAQPPDYIYDHEEPEEPTLSGVGGAWEGYKDNDWDTNDNHDLEAPWSSWAPCSATCGLATQKRFRPCGYACTATESRSCDLQMCTESSVPVTERPNVQMTNSSASLHTDVDSCETWLSCKNNFLQRYLHQVLTELPSCPCSYPSEVVYSAVHIPDARLKKAYRWRDASGPKERLDIYKPSARFCIRSMLSHYSATPAAQHCCYDDHMRLITRGKGAGAPNLISAEFSPELHRKVDVMPWILCKGDWSLVHSARPPNNGLNCTPNPPDHEFQTQLNEAREF